jgi:hypothetical protein
MDSVIINVAYETSDVNEANCLFASGEYRQPIYDAHRSLYIMIRRAKK